MQTAAGGVPLRNQVFLGRMVAIAMLAAGVHAGASAQSITFDFDGDGVPDEEDLCPLATDLTGPIPTETLCEGCLSDAETVRGCNASDVLDCKPGPNYHDRKFGVPAKAVDKFVNKLAWAKKCQYDPPPPPPPPETSGNASDVDELVLELPGASFIVPPAALPDGSPITFSYESPSVIEPDLLGPSETVITLVYSLAFSVQQPSAETMALDIEVPAGITGGIYAFFRVTSDLSNDTPRTAEWSPLPGEYDPSAGQFRVDLGATSELFTIFVVTRTPGSTASVLQKLETRFASLRRFVEGLVDSATELFGASTARAGQTVRGDLRKKGWIAYCRPEFYDNPALCENGSQALQELADTMYEAGVNLHGRGVLGPALLYSETKSTLFMTGLPFAWADPVGFPPTDEYHLVYMDEPGGEAPGQYRVPPGLPVVRTDSIANATPIHELFHAVVEADCPFWFKKQWIDESHAEATETWDPSWSGTSSDWRLGLNDGSPVWRAWELAVNQPAGSEAVDYERLAPYTLAELWLEADPALSYLPNLIDDCADMPREIPITEEYARFDTWLQQAGGPPLADAFVSVIEKRSADGDYPYCGSVLDPNDPEGPRVDPVECTTSPCELNETLDLALPRMSAECYRPRLTLPPSPDCPGQEIYNVEFGGDVAVHRYILDGTTYEPGDTIQDAPAAFELWALDKGIDDSSASSEGSVVVDSSCRPDEPDVSVRLLQQFYRLRASVRQTLNGTLLAECSSPFQVDEVVLIDSQEDGPSDSTRRFTRTEYDLSCPAGSMPFYRCDPFDQVAVIEPVGLGTVAESVSAQVVSNAGTPTACDERFFPPGTTKSASVDYTVSTRVLPSPSAGAVAIEGTMATSVFNGSPCDGQPPCGPNETATGLYTLQFEVDQPTSILLNHSCSSRAVSLSGGGMSLLNRVHWNNGQETSSWTCEPFSAQLVPGDTYFFAFDAGTSPFVSPEVQGRNLSADFSLVIGDQQ
jgi:hypothetical protein